MKKRITLMALLCAYGVSYSQEGQEVPSPEKPTLESKDFFESQESSFIDPDIAEWQKIEEAWKNNKILELLFAGLAFLKKRQDMILKNQTVIMQDEWKKRFEALERKQKEDAERHDKMLMQHNQLFSQQNRYQGG